MNLADACPQCHPGDHPANLPVWTHAVPGGGLCAHYACPACGHRWRTGWNPDSVWPQERTAA